MNSRNFTKGIVDTDNDTEIYVDCVVNPSQYSLGINITEREISLLGVIAHIPFTLTVDKHGINSDSNVTEIESDFVIATNTINRTIGS